VGAAMKEAMRLTVGMVDLRDGFRKICGDGYEEHIRPFRTVLRGVADSEGLPVAEAALKLCRQLSEKGHDPGRMICALVDECEGVPR
jgi:hypothetical protein